MWTPSTPTATVTRVVGTTTAGADGSFSFAVTPPVGTAVLTVVATAPDGATGFAQRTVVNDFVPGTLVFDVADPAGDDNGPGTYAYPTSDNFKPGAFDLRDFQVYDNGADVIFRVQTSDLTPTFGSPLGAQLVDVYVTNPAATRRRRPRRRSRAATTRSATAWNRLIEVQGFGQRFVDPAGDDGGIGRYQGLRDHPVHHVHRAGVGAGRNTRPVAGVSRSC